MEENRVMLEKRMLHMIHSQIRFNKERFEGILKNLNVINPLAILERGYSICSKDEESLKNTEGINPGDDIKIRLSRGSLDCKVKKIIEEDGFN